QQPNRAEQLQPQPMPGKTDDARDCGPEMEAVAHVSELVGRFEISAVGDRGMHRINRHRTLRSLCFEHDLVGTFSRIMLVSGTLAAERALGGWHLAGRARVDRDSAATRPRQ